MYTRNTTYRQSVRFSLLPGAYNSTKNATLQVGMILQHIGRAHHHAHIPPGEALHDLRQTPQRLHGPLDRAPAALAPHLRQKLLTVAFVEKRGKTGTWIPVKNRSWLQSSDSVSCLNNCSHMVSLPAWGLGGWKSLLRLRGTTHLFRFVGPPASLPLWLFYFTKRVKSATCPLGVGLSRVRLADWPVEPLRDGRRDPSTPQGACTC